MANPEPTSDLAMSDEEYREHFGMLTSAVRMIAMLPLDRIARVLSRVETLAPMLDPTGWIGRGHNVEDAQALVRGAQALMAEVAGIRERAKKRGVRVP